MGAFEERLFNELSRLCRFLKDFLNIFEFAQLHGCDLVCHKTEINTTSPYRGLVTRILMVFSEFECEPRWPKVCCWGGCTTSPEAGSGFANYRPRGGNGLASRSRS